jgi:hypothetical protein
MTDPRAGPAFDRPGPLGPYRGQGPGKIGVIPLKPT